MRILPLADYAEEASRPISSLRAEGEAIQPLVGSLDRFVAYGSSR
jgi:hypothetical protein